MHLRIYSKDLPYTYVEGLYPILEALTYQKKHIQKVILHSRSLHSKAVAKIKTELPENRIEVNDSALHRYAPKEYCLAMAVMEKYDTSVSDSDNAVLLYEPSDMGNMGTIIRSMTAFRVNQLVLVRPAADIFHPKVIRASMGSLFHIAFQYVNRDEIMKRIQSTAPFHWYYCDKYAKQKLPSMRFESPYRLMFGNEGSGFPKEMIAHCTGVSIPQTSEVDSLNLAVSAGIVLYHAANQGSVTA